MVEFSLKIFFHFYFDLCTPTFSVNFYCSEAMASVSKESERKNDLTQEEAFRYSRQMILPEIGLEGELELLTW